MDYGGIEKGEEGELQVVSSPTVLYRDAAYQKPPEGKKTRVY